MSETKSMKGHLSTVGKTDTWITPKYITEALGHFDLDPCAHTEMPWKHADVQYTVDQDGLFMPWFGRVWLNPPFNRYEIDKWFAKMAAHRSGILLTGAAFETKRFQQYVFGKATGMLLLNKRPHFHYPDGSRAAANSGQSICLIAYDEENLQALVDSNLGPVVTQLNKRK